MKKIHKLISSAIIIAIIFSYLGIISNAVEETGETTEPSNPGTSTGEGNTTDNTGNNSSSNSGTSGSSNGSQETSGNTGSSTGTGSSSQTTTTQTQRRTTSTSSSSAQAESSNANLSNLGIRPHDFTGFSPSKTSYSVTVPQDTESVEVYAQVADNGATVSGTGTVSLDEGENVVNVTVTAEDGTTKTYTINITRGEVTEETTEVSSGEGLSKLVIQQIREMTPEFETNVYEYTVKYIGENTSLPIEVEPTDESYQVEIVGNEDLKEGENLITILVSTSAGENVATYQITVDKSLVDEEALAREQAEKEQRQKTIIGAIVAIVVVLAVIIFIIIRRRRNRKFAEEYSGVPFYGMNNEEDYNEFEEEPKALKKKRKFIEDEDIDNEENEKLDDEQEEKDIMKMLAEDEDEKMRRQRVREKFLNGYNRNRIEDDIDVDDEQDYDDYDEEYEEHRKRRSKGKRFK